MGIFTSIKNAIFGHRDEQPAAAQAATAAAATAQPAAAPQPRPAVLDEVDVEARLDALPGASDLNWRSSIVDLMKLIGIDSSYENRKQLAEELGNTSYEGSADDNIALHRQTMQALAKNGGKVPRQFID
jgi:3-oxoacyl-ACP reductase-like protein